MRFEPVLSGRLELTLGVDRGQRLHRAEDAGRSEVATRSNASGARKEARDMDWPGKQSVHGMRVKERGFWKDPRTLAVLLRVKQG